jgi:hypothetical protein
MEKFIFAENRNESLNEETIRRVEGFVKDLRTLLSNDVIDIDLINKMIKNIVTFRDALENITPKNNDESTRIRAVIQDLNDLEKVCNQSKTLH